MVFFILPAPLLAFPLRGLHHPFHSGLVCATSRLAAPVQTGHVGLIFELKNSDRKLRLIPTMQHTNSCNSYGGEAHNISIIIQPRLNTLASNRSFFCAVLSKGGP